MDERGSTLPMFVGLFVVGLVVLGLAIDIAGAHATYVRTAAAADAVGEAAASMIDRDEAHAGVIALDSAAAEGEALRVAALRGVAVSDMAVAGDRVCVEVGTEYRTMALTFIGLPDVDVVVASCAEPAVG